MLDAFTVCFVQTYSAHSDVFFLFFCFRCSSTMKGGGRSKEPPVAGEVTGKRPKRKCLQWHPLLSKKALDFSEEEEEEDEEELVKVSGFPLQVVPVITSAQLNN